MILIIDDDEGCRATYEHWLKRRGAEVKSVTDGRAALELLGSDAASAVLVDLYMPGMEGIETIRHIRRRHPQCRIIAMSGMKQAGCDMLKAALALGADACLEKPFSLDKLLPLLQSSDHVQVGGAA